MLDTVWSSPYPKHRFHRPVPQRHVARRPIRCPHPVQPDDLPPSSPRHCASSVVSGVRLHPLPAGDPGRRNAAKPAATQSRAKPSMWPEGAANRMTEDTASAASPQSQAALHPQQQEMPLAVVHGQAVLQIPQDLYIPPDALEVILEAFEGPLDLLLYLIRRQNLEILDIPVAEITRQYVDY